MRKHLLASIIISALLLAQAGAQTLTPPDRVGRKGGGGGAPAPKPVQQAAPAQQQAPPQQQARPQRQQQQAQPQQRNQRASRHQPQRVQTHTQMKMPSNTPVRYTGQCQRDCRCPKHQRGQRNYRNRRGYGYGYGYGVPPYGVSPYGVPPYGIPPYGIPPYSYPYNPGGGAVAAPAPAPQPAEEEVTAEPPTPPAPPTGVSEFTLRRALNKYAAANSVGGKLYLPSGKNRWMVRYNGDPVFGEDSISIPSMAQKVGSDQEIPVTLRLTVDPETYDVVDVRLIKSQANLWRTNGVTFL